MDETRSQCKSNQDTVGFSVKIVQQDVDEGKEDAPGVELSITNVIKKVKINFPRENFISR